MEKPAKPVLIMGLGLNRGGLGVAEYFAKQGGPVLITDLKSEADLKPSIDALKQYSNITYVLGKHRKEDFENASLVIANPGVPPANDFVQAAKTKGVPVHTEMSYFFANKKCPVIGITGTRGKSTTTNLTYQIFEKAKRNVFLGGNIGVPVITMLETATPDQIAILEISSYMLEWMREFKQSPETGLITNVMPDHLSRHGTMEEYVNVKSTIVRFQDKSGTAILNIDDANFETFQAAAGGKVITFGRNPKAIFGIRDGEITENGTPLFTFESVIEDSLHPLAGEHNQMNILGAVAIARLHEIDVETIKNAIINYEELYGRQMFVGMINGRDVVNDTTATMPEAVIAALKRFGNRSIVLITGGTDKALSFESLAEELATSPIKAIVVLAGSASEKLLQELENRDVRTPIFAGYTKLGDAVAKAFEVSAEKDLILFSPGGSSFEMFQNEFDRGAQFDKIIESYKANEGQG